ncbi:MAG: undecaprenyldiphospho-muramoylpentapeptide beta-N-acetylglucosaminyltransferase [Pseudomonadota bacterium]
MSEGRCLIIAGGTGGHMFPARAAADALSERGWTVRLATDARGAHHAGGFPGGEPARVDAATPFVKNPIRMAGNLLKLARGVVQARALIRDFKPDVVAGFGGYVAYPGLWAARAAGVPYVLHEQNAVLGRVNRVFARSAFAVASGFERLDRLPADARHEVTGNPVREAIRAACGHAYAAPSADGPIELLVIGGSLGARILSEGVPEAVAALPEPLRNRMRVTQQTREESLQRARELYAAAGVEAVCEPFFEDIGALYAGAHLVIGRAGASSVAELAVTGRPSILIPLAIAMDDHQTGNAAALVDAGAADVIAEPDFAPQLLSARLETVLTDGEALARRAQAARDVGRAQAHDALADLIEAAAD